MKLTFITVSAPAISSLIEIGKEINGKYPDALHLKLYYAISDLDADQREKIIEDIRNSQLVFVDLMGSSPSTVKIVYEGLDKYSGNVIPYGNSAREYMRLGEFSTESMSADRKGSMGSSAMKNMGKNMPEAMEKSAKMKDMGNYSRIIQYFKIADKKNIQNMIYLMLREYGNQDYLPVPEDPMETKGVMIIDPSTMTKYSQIEDYYRDYPLEISKPTVVLFFYGHTYPTNTLPTAAKIKEKIEGFANVLPIAFAGGFAENEEALRSIIFESVKKPVDLLLNFMSFRLGAGPMGGNFDRGVNFLKDLDVPVLHPFFMSRRTEKEWKESTQGCSTSEVLISVMLPELDGCIETFPVGAMGDSHYDDTYQVITEELKVIEERADYLIERIKKHLALRQKKASEKKVAIICYNYPPGESNLFGGAFLDTFKSVENILKNLESKSYAVDALTKENLMEVFTAAKAVNSGKFSGTWEEMIRYPHKKYCKSRKNNEIVTEITIKGRKKLKGMEEIEKNWGEAPGDIMTDGDDYFIPGVILKNVFIGLQPSRGVHEKPDQSYHDKNLPPHHQYLAFYQWIEKEFEADVIIHVGTHGTLEFLKGKECGMSGECYPDQLIGHIPHLYLYYSGNPSEATIAKRRSHANLISYQPPVFLPSELDKDYGDLAVSVDNYHQSLSLSPGSSSEVLEDIMKKAEELHLPKDLEEIEEELYRRKTSLIPYGLHTFGQGFNQEEAKDYAKGLLRYSHGDITALRELIAKARGYELDVLFDENEYDLINELDQMTERIFDYYIEDEKLLEGATITESNKEDFIQTLHYGKKMMRYAQQNNEMESLFNALEGRYNPAKLAGDIYRNPEVLPTGYNLYQFDPRLIPTQSAFQRGDRACGNTLDLYYKETGTYPYSTAIILWGLETSRTQGESFGQILSYLGVKIAPQKSQWDMDFEIIPMEELKRPRIDVIVHICGFFRDMFPNLIESLDDLFHRLNELDETDEENYFKANTRKNYERLIGKGYDEDQARELSLSRIFGPGEGQYGTGIGTVFETKNWESEEEIGTLFMDRLQYVYNRQYRGKSVKGLYEGNLKTVELISQIRSNHEYEITDLDHYYEFFGGLSKSVEMVKGQKAKMYITDTTGERIFSEGVNRSIERGIRTRVLNPKWIDGMLEHSYHGVQDISKRFENILGFAATTDEVGEWIYDDLHKSYVEDEDLRKQLIKNNPYAYMDILEKMMEYFNRGYWEASQDQIDKIKAIYLQLEDEIESRL